MPGREGSRCLTRQEQVASYSRALVVAGAPEYFRACARRHTKAFSRGHHAEVLIHRPPKVKEKV